MDGCTDMDGVMFSGRYGEDGGLGLGRLLLLPLSPFVVTVVSGIV